MRERKSNSSGSWRVGLSINFLARLRNKVKKKADAFFVNHFFGEPEHAPPPPQPWTAPHSHNEASGSNNTSTQNSQYFDAVDPLEYAAQHQLPRFDFSHLQARSAQPHGVPSHQGFGMYHNADQPRDGMLMDLHLERPPSHDQGFLRDFDHQFHQCNSFDISGDISGEISDAVTEMQRDEPPSSWQGNIDYSQAREAPSMSMQMSGDTLETVDSNMMDTGDSSYILPPNPEQQRDLIKQYIQRVRHILFEDELRLPGKRGFRVVASIVYVFRKLRGIVRLKRMQRTGLRTPVSGELEASRSCKMKRTRSVERSKMYQGIKRRKGKWVAEIRVSKMPDKVWLGSFPSEKEAALAYDAGLHHCSLKRSKIFNFKESPAKLGPSQYESLHAMSKEDRKTKVQRLANDHAMAYGSSNNIR